MHARLKIDRPYERRPGENIPAIPGIAGVARQKPAQLGATDRNDYVFGWPVVQIVIRIPDLKPSQGAGTHREREGYRLARLLQVQGLFQTGVGTGPQRTVAGIFPAVGVSGPIVKDPMLGIQRSNHERLHAEFR